MSFFHAAMLAGASGNQGPYQIEQSLRFDGSGTYLQRTPSSSGNRQTFTISFWIKRGQLGSHQQNILTGNANNGLLIAFTSTDELYFYDFGIISGGFQIWSQKKFRDPSAWYHIVFAADTTQATASNRVKVWINGIQEDLSTYNVGAGAQRYPGQNGTFDWNHTNSHEIGYTTTDAFEGYLAEIHNVDGSQLDHEDFGEYDNNGVWRPIEYTSSYGTNGFYLKLDETATNGIGHDDSGNGNNFTASGFVTSGVGTDVMSDTPTTNYATLSPLWARNTYGLSTLSNGNLEFSDAGISTSWGGRGSTFEISSGKWYMEWKCTDASGQNLVLAVLNTGHYGLEHFMVQNPQNQTGCWGPQENGSSRWIILNGTQNTSGAPYYDTLNGQIVGIAIDADAGTATWYRHGTAITALTDIDISASSKDAWVVMGITSNGSGTSFVANFGQRAFEQTPPTGYSAWNTSALPAPTIKDGSDNFNTVIYTGASPSDQAVTGVGFQPDFTWIKARTQAYSHALYDAVRGATEELHTDTTDQEDTDTNGLKSFDSDGFTVGSDGEVGDPTGTRVSWNWKANGSGSSNTDGSVTSTVSANPSAGFSIVTWSNQGTVGHGLGVAPSWIIVKSRDQTSGWWVYATALGNSNYGMPLHSTAGQNTGINWGGAPTSTVFYISSGNGALPATSDNIAYCFAEVEGYCKASKYTGNGSSDGPFVYTGFAPAFLLIGKTSSGAGWNWQLRDSKRPGYNVNNDELRANSNAAELSSSAETIDFLSNGFKPRSANGATNQSGYTYIYLALAENPFGGSGVSPTTAR